MARPITQSTARGRFSLLAFAELLVTLFNLVLEARHSCESGDATLEIDAPVAPLNRKMGELKKSFFLDDFQHLLRIKRVSQQTPFNPLRRFSGKLQNRSPGYKRQTDSLDTNSNSIPSSDWKS